MHKFLTVSCLKLKTQFINLDHVIKIEQTHDEDYSNGRLILYLTDGTKVEVPIDEFDSDNILDFLESACQLSYKPW